MIDSHHHFWWIGRHTYHWPDAGRRPLRARLHARRPASGARALRHQRAPCWSRCCIRSAARPRSASISCKEVGFVRGVVGWLPLADPDATAQAIERLRPRGGKLVGVRHLISNEPDPRWLLQDGVVESLKLLAAAGLAFDAIPVNAAQFESVLEVAQRLPDLKIVLNHLGRPPIPEQGWEPWATQIARAAEHRNMSIKLSIGLDIIMRWRWSTDAIRALFRSCARPVHLQPRDGGEQLAGDPAGRQLRAMLERHRRARCWACPPTSVTPSWAVLPSAFTACNLARMKRQRNAGTASPLASTAPGLRRRAQRATASSGLRENQRLDHDRHRAGIRQHCPDVDKVEVVAAPGRRSRRSHCRAAALRADGFPSARRRRRRRRAPADGRRR